MENEQWKTEIRGPMEWLEITRSLGDVEYYPAHMTDLPLVAKRIKRLHGVGVRVTPANNPDPGDWVIVQDRARARDLLEELKEIEGVGL